MAQQPRNTAGNEEEGCEERNANVNRTKQKGRSVQSEVRSQYKGACLGETLVVVTARPWACRDGQSCPLIINSAQIYTMQQDRTVA